MRRCWVLAVLGAVAMSFTSVAWACVPTGGQEKVPTTAAVPSGDAGNSGTSQYGEPAETTSSDESSPGAARAVAGVAFLAAGAAAVVFGVVRVRGRRDASAGAPLPR